MKRRLASLAAVLALSGCASSTDTAKLDPYRDTVAACHAVFDALFSMQARCGVTQAYAERIDNAVALRCDGLNRPTVSGDTSALRACAEAIDGLACWEDLGPIRDDPFVGTAPAGAACQSDIDCAPALWGCLSTGTACGGTCAAFGGAGAPCGVQTTPDCADGLWCDGATCQAAVALNGACNSTYQCAADLHCVGAAGPLTCQPVAGAPCTGSYDCDTSTYGAYYCRVWAAPSTCALTGTVAADELRCGGGKACPGDQFCDASSICAPRRTSGACPIGTECLAPADCVAVNLAGAKECHVPAKLGQPCVAGLNLCELGAFCAAPQTYVAGTCATWPSVGGTCGVLNGELVGCIDGWCKPSDTGGPGSCSPYTAIGNSLHRAGAVRRGGRLRPRRLRRRLLRRGLRPVGAPDLPRVGPRGILRARRCPWPASSRSTAARRSPTSRRSGRWRERVAATRRERATRWWWWSPRWATPPTSCSRSPSRSRRTPPRRELDMLLTCGRADLDGAAVDGAAGAGRAGDQLHRQPERHHHQRRARRRRASSRCGPFRIQDELARGQGGDRRRASRASRYKREVTTLGRGGSDTTAVALAAALGAEAARSTRTSTACSPPTRAWCPTAQQLEALSYDEMQELA